MTDVVPMPTADNFDNIDDPEDEPQPNEEQKVESRQEPRMLQKNEPREEIKEEPKEEVKVIPEDPFSYCFNEKPYVDPSLLTLKEQQKLEYEEAKLLDLQKIQQREEDEKLQEDFERIEEQKQEDFDNEVAISMSMLKNEPEEGDPEAAVIQIRLADGNTVTRRFLKTASIEQLYLYIKSMGEDAGFEEITNDFELFLQSKKYDSMEKSIEEEGLFPRSKIYCREL